MCHRCPRQWAGHYIFGHPQFQGEAALKGNHVHDQCDALLKGKPAPHAPETSFNKMAVALLERGQVGDPRPALLSEVKELVDLPDDIVELRCDVLELDRRRFTDWKTTGASGPTARLPNGKFWTIQPGGLAHDWQARTYAHLIMVATGWPSVEAQWVYVCTKFAPGQTPRTWAVPHTFERDETAAWFEAHSEPVIELMMDLQLAAAPKTRDPRASSGEKLAGTLTSLQDVPHNPLSCEAKGLFCDVAGHCQFKQSPIVSYAGLHLPIIP